MDCYQFIDFGSTFTKLTLVDIEKEEILATAKSYTTVESDVTIGYEKALQEIYSKVDKDKLNIKKITACSSAAGGLKVVAIGLVPELTAEAAKRAALGAGARILNTYSFNLNDSELTEIKNSGLDIILLAGGTDGGNEECIIHNAKMIAKHEIDVPVVVGGNKSATDKIKDIFEGKIEYYITENVMPNLKKINVDPARETIRNIFMKNIVKAKGMERIHEFLSDIAMPTPAAVLRAARVLSVGTEIEDGLGDLVVVDIGGATTDIHSLADGFPSQGGVMMRGLEEPFAKRTVEGDLGMRYSAMAVYEAAGLRTVKKYIDVTKYDKVEDEFAKRYNHPDFLSETKDEKEFDIGMAQICARLSMQRHAGTISEIFSPVGKIYNQEGKDLLKIPYIIGTGGVIINNEEPSKILSAAKFSPEDPQSLRPEDPKYLIDKSYILSSMGLLSMIDADMAVRMMKKYLVEV
ncbi:MAG: methylaspartate mutase accessory protein GlmL [Tissierellia bacterium]|nr:methylaspartate mutase accessory protein GlmL [Tissierellia bacterium]